MSMSMLEAKMIHRGVIKRAAEVIVDTHNNPVGSAHEVMYSGPCRLVEKSERLISTAGAPADAFVTTYKLILPITADVEERDIIDSITFETGEVVAAGKFVVKSLLTRRFLRYAHHKVAILDKVT